jgi:hypothetical protein
MNADAFMNSDSLADRIQIMERSPPWQGGAINDHQFACCFRKSENLFRCEIPLFLTQYPDEVCKVAKHDSRLIGRHWPAGSSLEQALGVPNQFFRELAAAPCARLAACRRPMGGAV